MRVFLDANFLIAAGLKPLGDYNRVLETDLDQFVTSEHLLNEVSRNLKRLDLDPVEFISRLRKRFEITDQFNILPAGLPLDGAGDRQALAEAIGARCDVFVTSDTDFGDLFGQNVRGVLIEKSARYARRIVDIPG